MSIHVFRVFPSIRFGALPHPPQERGLSLGELELWDPRSPLLRCTDGQCREQAE